MKATTHLIEAMTVAMELTGTSLSDPAVMVLLSELAVYPEPAVLAALRRCCGELKSRLTLADILDRIPNNHPGAEEAWSICAGCLNNEALSVVWTDEMSQAFGVASGLKGDPVAARMAFKETYSASVARARIERRMPKWAVSLGSDKGGRELAILDAVDKGRLGLEHARGLLPYHRDDAALHARLLSANGRALALLPAPQRPPGDEWKRLGEKLGAKA